MLLLSLASVVFDSVRPHRGSPPGSSVPGILQGRTLEWGAISFSNTWKWKVKVKSLSRVWLLATSWTAAHQAPPSIGFARQEYWSGVPLPSLNPIVGYKKYQRAVSPSVDALDVLLKSLWWFTRSYKRWLPNTSLDSSTILSLPHPVLQTHQACSSSELWVSHSLPTTLLP